MSRDDYRPSEAQIHHHYRCDQCGSEVEVQSFYVASSRCGCGGKMIMTGESYPGNRDDWDEQRDPDGEWRPRRW